MWPKLFLDLLPHFSRLMPVADKYLAGRSASDKAHQDAMTALRADVRGQMGRVTEAQTGVNRQLQQQSAQISELSVDAARARMGIESVEERVAKLEKSVGMVVKLAGLVLLLTAMTLSLVVFRMVR